MILPGRKGSTAARQNRPRQMPINRASQKAKSDHVFGQRRRRSKMFRAGLYSRVSTNDQQTLAMQNRAMREYVTRRGWTVALQVREVNSGATRREAREKLEKRYRPVEPGHRANCQTLGSST